MTVKKDYYELLGVSRNASPEEIKRAFRRLAFQCHPDHNNEEGSAERFKEINEAYEVLSDTSKRAKYDSFGHIGYGRSFDGFDDLVTGFGDIFDAFFGGTANMRQRVPRKGSDLHCSVEIAFEEAAFGCEKSFEVTRTERCTRCEGNRSEPGTYPTKCPNCNGIGEVRRVHQSIFGRFVNRVMCDRCEGDGTVVDQPCSRCRGTGRERVARIISIDIPAGIEDRSQLRLRGEGDFGLWGGPAGNIYVDIGVKDHELFKREGSNVRFELAIDFAQAALGDKVEVPTLDGSSILKINPGTQTGTVLVMKGKGIPRRDGPGRGDQLVEVKVVTPDKLSREQREIFQELARSLGKTEASQRKKKRLIEHLTKTTREDSG